MKRYSCECAWQEAIFVANLWTVLKRITLFVQKFVFNAYEMLPGFNTVKSSKSIF